MAFNKLAIASVQEALNIAGAADLTALEADVLSIDLALTGTQSDVAVLQGSTATLQGDVSTLQTSVGNLQTDVTNLQGDVGTLQGDVTTLQGDVSTIQTQLSNPVIIGTGAGAGAVPPVVGCVAVGNMAGNDSQQSNAISIGTNAGLVQQGSSAIAIGENCGATQQGQYAIAIGAGSGGALQGQEAIAIGYTAGVLGQQSGAIAIGGTSANGLQQAYAVALGYGSGTASSSGQGASSVAIGHLAGGTDGMNDQPANSIALNATGLALLPTGASQTHIAPVRENNIVPSYVLQYDPATSEVYRSNVLVPAYGSFSLNTSITVGGLNVPTPITYDTTEIASGISFDPLSPSHITVAQTGIYKLSYSIQFDKSGGGTSQVDIWIAVDGTEVPRSASQGSVNGPNGEVFMMCEYILSLTSSNFVEVYFTSNNDATMAATAFPAVPLVRPSVPACITNLYRIA